jgi:hypothetical protein
LKTAKTDLCFVFAFAGHLVAEMVEQSKAVGVGEEWWRK